MELTDIQIAESTNLTPQGIQKWLKKKHYSDEVYPKMKFRYEALKIGVTILSAGLTLEIIVSELESKERLKKANKDLRKKLKDIEDLKNKVRG